MPQRVVLFIDYQNMYKDARRAFHRQRGPGFLGQIRPLALGELICARSPDRALSGVRIYRGAPTRGQDWRMHQVATSQRDEWERDPLVTVNLHPLRRGSDGRLREKGVDVDLAVEFVDGAHRDHFDVGIVFSGDTDFIPALKLVQEIGPVVETASWSNRRKRFYPRNLGAELGVFCHHLHRDAYLAVSDFRLYPLVPEAKGR